MITFSVILAFVEHATVAGLSDMTALHTHTTSRQHAHGANVPIMSDAEHGTVLHFTSNRMWETSDSAYAEPRHNGEDLTLYPGTYDVFDSRPDWDPTVYEAQAQPMAVSILQQSKLDARAHTHTHTHIHFARQRPEACLSCPPATLQHGSDLYQQAQSAPPRHVVLSLPRAMHRCLETDRLKTSFFSSSLIDSLCPCLPIFPPGSRSRDFSSPPS